MTLQPDSLPDPPVIRPRRPDAIDAKVALVRVMANMPAKVLAYYEADLEVVLAYIDRRIVTPREIAVLPGPNPNAPVLDNSRMS
jgi:hypothetical protein